QGIIYNIYNMDGGEILAAVKNIQESDLAPLKDAIKAYESIGRGYQKLKHVFVKELISDLSKADALEAGLQSLSTLGVTQNADLNALVHAVGLLEQTIELYRTINAKRSEMLPHVSAELRSLFEASESGFTELRTFAANASSIPAAFLKYREDVFESPDFPDVFTEIEDALGALLSEREALEKDFKLESLPDNDALAQHARLLSETHAFSWAKSTWRASKAAVLAIAKAEKIEYREFAKRVDALLAWKKACEEFEGSSKYAGALGTQFDGLKTDLERIAKLKDWYLSVRKEYGVGFGQRVPLARALYSLPVDVLQGVQGLAEGGLSDSISSFIENLRRLSAVFTKPACFSEPSVKFDQEVNPLNSVLFEIRSSLAACQGLLVDPSISLSLLMQVVFELKHLRAAIVEAEKADINKNYFDSALNLAINDSCEFHTDLLRVVSTYKFVASLHNAVRDPRLIDLVKNASDKATLDSIRDAGSKLASACQAAKGAENTFLIDAQALRSQWFAYSGEQLSNVVARNSKAINNEVWLDGWLKYLFARERMEQGGFGKLKQYLCEGDYTLEHAQNVMKFATYQCLAHEIYREVPALGERSGHEQTALQQQFAKYDEKLKELQRKRVAALCAKREAPAGISGARVSSYTDDVLLNNEIKKKTKHISIRNLVLRAGDAMQAYKPCFMMSPMAVAKYIPPGALKFDLVIMDEASQVKPEYALSSFARGKQVVVVGDPKQLPPTNFFERSVSNDSDLWDDEKESSVVDDAESILDAVESQFPSRQLRWHYRSRHESLIDFSNHNFYDSNLVVFPSPWNDSSEYGIKFLYVDNARFLKGVNVTESQNVVAAIRDHLLEKPEESLGVVAMNAKQKEQIEADFELAIAEDKLLLAAYEKNLQTLDPMFVKNLENVQGDERDVIYISFTYGPQEKGAASIPQRFGPITWASGWRRLNVLFTRAKKRIHAFSSMTANQIVVSETSSRGVRALREYLEYAQNGRLVQQAGVKQREPDSDFEIAVIKALNKEGFECVPQVGVAGFYIDIAVKDPGMPGRYLMGVECDGASYHSTKSTRDRDRVRQSVLEGLGWNIKRIWSTDWFKNPKAELKPIIDELKELSTPIADFDAEQEVAIEEDPILGVTDAESYLADVAQSLDERLLNFAVNVIQREFPDTPMESRLLRPDMLDRLIKDKPVNRDDFSIFVPRYLRENTCPKEAGQFLDYVLEIIADFEENEVA
ncbi:MAG: AAA domain-containing protein, partial [Pseudomonadales bacterium]|nr:AAA domain-containing protein [Pseudomonadales bacterium]